MNGNTLTRTLSAHPKLTGALLTGTLLLAQVGSVMAGHSTGYPGP
jgi:hypothetical protein